MKKGMMLMLLCALGVTPVALMLQKSGPGPEVMTSAPIKVYSVNKEKIATALKNIRTCINNEMKALNLAEKRVAKSLLRSSNEGAKKLASKRAKSSMDAKNKKQARAEAAAEALKAEVKELADALGGLGYFEIEPGPVIMPLTPLEPGTTVGKDAETPA